MEFMELLRMQLEQKGFYPVRNQENWYWKAENPVLYLLCILEDGTDWREEQRVFSDFSQKMEARLEEFYCSRAVALSLLIEKEGQTVMEPEEQPREQGYDATLYRVFWQVSPKDGKITAGVGQPDRLIGIEKLLRAAAKGEEPEVLVLREEKEQKKPIATAVIFGICLLLLLVTMFSPKGDFLLWQFGLSREGIANGEYYRFLTSMFLHGGIVHLLSNSVYLYYFGVRTERLLGTGRFLLLYLVSGLCGGLLSVALGDGGISIGASGAIYGLLGAMLLLTKKRGSRYTDMSYATMLLLAGTAIGMGFLEPGVDNLAHIGGFLGGIMVFALLLRKK